MDSPDMVGAAQLDLLKELANIGVGNAVTALSVMLNDQRINMHVPEAKVTSLQEVPDSFGDPENMVAATYCEADCADLGLVLLFVLPLEAAENMVARLLPGASQALDEMERSLLMELGNIITGSFLSALSFMTALTFSASTPRLGIDMAGAVLGTVIAETKIVEDNLILLKTTLQVEDEGIEGSVLILPDSGSLQTLLKNLGGC
ncbi:MAG: chemotaxis protein CheC [Bacillota bacterium]